MDRTTLLNHFALAKEDLAEGDRHIERQESLIVMRERDGLDTATASAILNILRKRQAMHRQNVKRILRELGQTN